MDKKDITMVISKGLGEANLPNTDYQEIKAAFDRLCDKQESLYKPEFETVFKELFKLDATLTKDYPCTKDEALLNEALRVAGFETNEDFCADFKQYNTLFVKGKELQEKGVELLANNFPQRKRLVEGWHFMPMEIAGTPELIQIVDDIMERDAQEGSGLYANITQIPKEDEALDEFLCVDAYGLKCSFVPFLDELKRYGIVGSDNTFFSNKLTISLFALLKKATVYLKEHTDKPQAIKNEIARLIKEFDSIPHWGLFLQILFLQGLCRLLEGVNIKEGDDGYNEGCSLYTWIFEQLANKEVCFCCKPYFGEDLKLLKPLCAYLMDTQVGQFVQDVMFGNELQTEQAIPEPQQEERPKITNNNLPSELDTDEAHKFFAKARTIGLMNGDYIWLRGKQLLACFCHDMSQKLNLGKGDRIAWKPFEVLFGIEKGKLRSNYNDIQKTGQNPKDIDLVDKVFK